MMLRAKSFEWVFPRPALIMGILNVTPDSFSDGGRHATTDAAVAHALQLIEEGADIIDVGGESTRPGAAIVDEAGELRRVLPVLEQLSARTAVALSIDTMKPAVARAALATGASLVNDVAANRASDEMWRLVAETRAGYVAMHMQGTPQTMQTAPRYGDVVADVNAFFGERLERIQAAGVSLEQVVLDVGIGFGKTLEHNLQLLRSIRSFTRWERPLLLGVSRKSFIGQALGAPLDDRLAGALACAVWAVESGVQIIRTHDVKATAQAVRMIEKLRAGISE